MALILDSIGPYIAGYFLLACGYSELNSGEYV